MSFIQAYPETGVAVFKCLYIVFKEFLFKWVFNAG